MPVLHTQGAHWQNLENMTEPSMCGGDAAFVKLLYPVVIMLG